jgi:hypothetical protein
MASRTRERIWEVRFTSHAEGWYMGLGTDDAHRIAAALDELTVRGPALGRPLADSLRGSRHHNMKELRSIGGNLRALFAFDPQRRAVVLLGGDKTGDWKGWYKRNLPLADRLYDNHLRTQGKEAPWRNGPPRPGGRSAGSGR